MAVMEAEVEQSSAGFFEDVFSRNRKGVYRYALRVLGNPSDAEDVTQETFIKVYRSLSSFRGDCTITTWIFRIAANACMDNLRSSRRREVLCLDGQKDREALGFQVADVSPDPAEIAEGVDVREGVMTCLRRLRNEHRTVLVLREIKDMSYVDISRKMGCPVGTVKSKLNRARAALKREVLDSVPV